MFDTQTTTRTGDRPETLARTRMTSRGKTVLLVEDNEDNRIVYSTILRHFGYTVSEAMNGEEGIAKARTEKPDLILMDISIPIIDGWEATQVLKHDPADEGDSDHRPDRPCAGLGSRESDAGSRLRRVSWPNRASRARSSPRCSDSWGRRMGRSHEPEEASSNPDR